MTLHKPVPFWPSAAGIVMIGLWSVTVLPAGFAEQPGSRSKQIADIEKQIQALNKKLIELRGGNGAARVNSGQPGGNWSIDPAWLKTLKWRSIGPASMGGRITAISVFEADPSTYFVATASGGLLKTVNNGTTFAHLFDHEKTVSIGDVCVAPSDRNIVWVGTGEANPRNSVSYGDGVYKSTDGGKTWKNMGLKNSFQIGRIVVHPKDPNVVYVGALGRLYGPNEERGLFKTTDGGKTWKKVLYTDANTGVIDVQMNPADPETLLVALWERRRDEFDSYQGGPPQPDGYDRYDPIKKYGPTAGIYKTTDGGKTFKKVTKGLPTCQLGRISISYYRKNPKVVYAIIDSEKIGMGPPQAAGNAYLGATGGDADAGARLLSVLPGSPAEKAGLKAMDIVLSVDNKVVLAFSQLAEQLQHHKAGDKVTLKIARNKQAKDIVVTLGKRPGPAQAARSRRPFGLMFSGQQENVQDKQGPEGLQYGGVYKSSDGGESWTRVNSINPRPMYFSQIRVDPGNDQYVYVLGFIISCSQDGGKTFKPNGSQGVHPDQHALWIDPRDGRHMIVGCDGGFYVTYDRMANWDFLNHLAIGQFYHVTLDSRRPYHVYGGLQDNGSWGGPSHSLRGPGPTNDEWIMVGGGDGFVCRVDPNDPDLVYCESQDGNMMRRNLRTGEIFTIRPQPRKGLSEQLQRYLAFLLANRNNPLSLAMTDLPFLKRMQQSSGYRFNWNTPFILSSHNSHIFYCAGNYVFRSLNRGNDLRPISPQITRTPRGSSTALAESPRNPDVLYVGTDDGALWVTRDGGNHWWNIAPNIKLPGPRWLASIEPSHFVQGRAYVVFDAHRSNDDEPYVFVTEDFGQSWRSLRANLPSGPTRVLREDIHNPNLLFLGTEFACWVSLNRGDSWIRLNNNLPTVAVHELAIHATTGEMVAATHGRSLWVLDITPLRQMTPAMLQASAYLFQPQTAVRWRSKPPHESFYGAGARRFVGQNPPPGALIYYALTKKAATISLKVLDYDGKVIQTLKASGEPGLHRVAWNLMRAPLVVARPQNLGRSPSSPSRLGRPGGPAAPGVYRVVLTVDGKELTQNLRVEADPNGGTNIIAPDEEKEQHRQK